MAPIFPTLILNARPAAGKSEISRYLASVPLKERIDRFHVGEIHALDDFPMLWEWFEEDDLLEEAFSMPRLHSTSDHYFLEEEYWHLLIHKLNLEYAKCAQDEIGDHTSIIEFSRGVEHGGYREAYSHLSDEILRDAAVLYVNVSFEESLRKNRVRHNPDRPYSLLQHSLEEEKMYRLYRDDDWASFTSSDNSRISVRHHRIPYVKFENEDDITTRGGEQLGERLEIALESLWGSWGKGRGDS